MKAPAQERLPAIDDLLAFILRFIQVPSYRVEFKVKSERRTEFLLLFGLTHRVRRLAQSYIRLRKDGFESEGQILIRSALEHAMTAQWAYLTVGGLSRLQASATRDQYTLAKLLSEYSTDPNMTEVAEEYRRRVEPGAQLPKIVDLIQQLDNNGFLRTTYKVLSQVTHVTHQATLDALDTDENGNISLRLKPEQRFGHENLYALAACCLLSAWVIAHIEDDEDEIRRLDEYAVALQMPYRLDASIPDKLRRFNDNVTYDDR